MIKKNEYILEKYLQDGWLTNRITLVSSKSSPTKVSTTFSICSLTSNMASSVQSRDIVNIFVILLQLSTDIIDVVFKI